MKRICTATVGTMILIAGLLGVWSTIFFVEFVADHILVTSAVACAALIAAGAGLMIRAFSRTAYLHGELPSEDLKGRNSHST